MHHRTTAVAVTLFAAPAAFATATASLDTNALPSTQPGWTIEAVGVHASYTEAEAFTPGPTAMTLDTMSEPAINSPGSFAAVHAFDPMDVGADPAELRISARVRVVDSFTVQFNYGFYMAVAADGWGMSLGLGEGLMSFSDLSSAAIDATQWRDYLLVGDLDAQTYDVYVDGDLFAEDEPMYATSDVAAYIGDGTGTGNARTEIQRFVATVPAPGALAIAGFSGLISLRRRRR